MLQSDQHCDRREKNKIKYHLCPNTQVGLGEGASSSGGAPSLGIRENARTDLLLLPTDKFLVPDIRLAVPYARASDVDVGHVAVAHHALDTDLLDRRGDGLDGPLGGDRHWLHRRLQGRLHRVARVVAGLNIVGQQVVRRENERRLRLGNRSQRWLMGRR